MARRASTSQAVPPTEAGLMTLLDVHRGHRVLNLGKLLPWESHIRPEAGLTQPPKH